MEKKTQKIITQIALAASVVLLQVLSMRISYFHEQLTMNLEYGLESTGITLLMEGLSLLSGIVLAWLPDIRPQKEISHKEVNVGFLLLFIFTLLLVVSKVLMLGFGLLWSVDFIYNLLSPFRPFGDWALFTTVPSLLAGFSLGKLLRR
jgi:hypothetical protein